LFLAKMIITLTIMGFVYLLFLQFSLLNTTIESLKSLTEMAAIIIAGLWTYNRFIKNREDYPYPKIEHKTTSYKLSKSIVYLSVIITVVNEGKTKLDLGKGKIYIRQVSPIPDGINILIAETVNKSGLEPVIYGNAPELFRDMGQRVGWATLGSRNWETQLRNELKELEPGQTRETQFDFLFLDRDEVEIVQVISYFNFGKSHWELATLHSLVEFHNDAGIK